MDNPDWRFFTEPFVREGVVAHLWTWAQLNQDGSVVASASGYHTIIAAMHAACAHGFPGPVAVGDPEPLLTEFGDRRAFRILCTV